MTQPIHPMLKRVATGIFHELNKEGQYIPDWLRLVLARAAIQALLDPTLDMCDDATEVPIDDGRGGMTALNWSEAATVLQAMLKPLLGDEGWGDGSDNL